MTGDDKESAWTNGGPPQVVTVRSDPFAIWVYALLGGALGGSGALTATALALVGALPRAMWQDSLIACFTLAAALSLISVWWRTTAGRVRLVSDGSTLRVVRGDKTVHSYLCRDVLRLKVSNPLSWWEIMTSEPLSILPTISIELTSARGVLQAKTPIAIWGADRADRVLGELVSRIGPRVALEAR